MAITHISVAPLKFLSFGYYCALIDETVLLYAAFL